MSAAMPPGAEGTEEPSFQLQGAGSTNGARASGGWPERQRAQILDATIELVGERGLAATSVSLVVSRASVSSRTFYRLFDGLNDCLLTVMRSTLEHVIGVASKAFDAEDTWRGGLRLALASVLGFFDAEPELARICLVESLAGSPGLLEGRQRFVESFRGAVIQRVGGQVSHASPLAAESALASVLGVVHARLIEHDPRPLVELVGPLMGTLIAPFVPEEAVAREIALGDELARAIQAAGPDGNPLQTDQPGASTACSLWAVADLPGGRLRDCLLHLAQHPGSSNGEIASAIGISHASQISKLLARLEREALVAKRSNGPGMPNAWQLTSRGTEIAQALIDRPGSDTGGPAGLQ
jgi:AcrR family transcriptional regulator